jgi:porin
MSRIAALSVVMAFSICFCPKICPADNLPDGYLNNEAQKAEDTGLEFEFGATSIYQHNTRGGLSTHRRAGRFSGSYDLQLKVDMQRLLGWDKSSLHVHAEGWWSESGGIDVPSVGSVFGVNGDAMVRNSMVVAELWYQRSLFDDSILFRFGKMDPTGGSIHAGIPVAFDGNCYANDETSQFLNSAMVNNPTIPFPDYALGISALYTPVDNLYVSAGIIDAQNDFRETGFDTTFHEEDYFFYIVEAGVMSQLDSSKGPLPGAYRIGVWNDPQPKGHSDAVRTWRDDTGLYLSCDQMIAKENNDSEDNQGIGAFFRYGYAESKRNDVNNFWSFGLQYQGPLEGRNDDVMGIGFAQGFFSDRAVVTYPQDYEIATEVYYNAHINESLSLSPSLQYIANPGGVSGVSDAVVLGIRAQITF